MDWLLIIFTAATKKRKLKILPPTFGDEHPWMGAGPIITLM
jgi:hypothetical protein